MTNIASRLRTELRSEEWLRERLDYLTKFITDERREVLQRTVDSRTHYMRILTENMFHPQNASAIMRHCEAFGIQQIHTVEDRCKFDPSVNIVRGTQKWVDVEHHDTTAEALATLKAEGYRIVATADEADLILDGNPYIRKHDTVELKFHLNIITVAVPERK